MSDPRLPPWWFRPALSMVVVVGGLGFIGWAIVMLSPHLQKEVILIAVGAVVGWVGSVITYYYGSSQGSDDQQAAREELERVARTEEPKPPMPRPSD